MCFTAENGVLIRQDGAKIQFDFPVANITVANDITVVCLEIPPKTIMNQNVFGLDRDGAIMWQVPYNIKVASESKDSPYIEVKSQDDGTVMAYNWSGHHARLNPKTGGIIEVIFGK